MKKEYIKKYKYLYQGFAFIWHQCSKCKKEIRFEKMWRALVGPFYGGMGNWSYLCTNCCDSNKKAHKYYLKGEYRTEKPPYRVFGTTTGRLKANVKYVSNKPRGIKDVR